MADNVYRLELRGALADAFMLSALRACGCYGEWTEARAAAWWQAHAPGELS